MHATWLLVTLVLGFAGCLDAASSGAQDPKQSDVRPSDVPSTVPASADKAPPQGGERMPVLKLDNRTGSGVEAVSVAGPRLVAPTMPTSIDGPCAPPNCHRHRLHVEVPTAYWTQSPGSVEVLADWNFENDAELELSILDAAGEVLAVGAKPPGVSEFRPIAERSINYATIVRLASLATGHYEVQVRAIHGASPYRVTAQVEPTLAPANPAAELLPNLRMLPPAELRIVGPSDPLTQATEAAGRTRGCAFEEHVEHEVARCLRFSSAYANAGTGALELELAREQLDEALQGTARIEQRVYRTDGTSRAIPAGIGELHASHHHFHLARIMENVLYAYNVSSDQRGEEASASRKVGFCFIDVGVHAVEEAGGPASPRYGPEACFNPAHGNGLVMGISAGWYDLYWWSLTDQYVDVTDLRDGTYELVSRVNSAGTLLESTLADNEASVVFRLEDDEVTVLGRGG